MNSSPRRRRNYARQILIKKTRTRNPESTNKNESKRNRREVSKTKRALFYLSCSFLLSPRSDVSSRRVGPVDPLVVVRGAHRRVRTRGRLWRTRTHTNTHTHKPEHRWALIIVQTGDVMDCFTRSLSLLILLSLSLNEGLSSKTSFWTPPPGPGIGGEAMAMTGGIETPYAPLELSSRAGVHHIVTHVDDMGGSDRQVSPCMPAKHTITCRRLKRL